MKHPLLSLMLFAMMLLPATSWAQTRIKLKQADHLASSRNPTTIDRIRGNVVFIHDSTTIHCDSAWFNRKENSIEAFGNVRIQIGNDTMTGTRLKYDGNTNKAVLHSVSGSHLED
jgi:lipopolysaccharide assembly outer membrane protein LptD (OstA)